MFVRWFLVGNLGTFDIFPPFPQISPTTQKCINVNTSQLLLATPSQGQTPLYVAAWHDQLEPMKLILEAKANMETADIDGGDLDKPGEDEAVQEWDGDGMDSGV